MLLLTVISSIPSYFSFAKKGETEKLSHEFRKFKYSVVKQAKRDSTSIAMQLARIGGAFESRAELSTGKA